MASVESLWIGGLLVAVGGCVGVEVGEQAAAVEEDGLGVTRTLASGLAAPRAAALGSNHAFWADEADGGVYRVLKSHPLGYTRLAQCPSGGDAMDVASDGYHVYFTCLADGTVNKVPVGGGAAEELSTGQPSPFALWVTPGAAGSVFFTTLGAGSGNGAVKRVGKAGGATFFISGGLFRPETLAGDGTYLFWGEGNGNARLQRLELGGAPQITTLLTGEKNISSVGVDASAGTGYVFFTTSGDGKVSRVGKDGAALIRLATAQDSPTGLSVFGNGVFWANEHGGQIQKVPRAGGFICNVAGGQGGPLDTATDASGVYWVNRDGGQVRTSNLCM